MQPITSRIDAHARLVIYETQAALHEAARKQAEAVVPTDDIHAMHRRQSIETHQREAAKYRNWAAEARRVLTFDETEIRRDSIS